MTMTNMAMTNCMTVHFLCIIGEPPKTGTATIRIYTKNKNDEEPKFSQQVYTPNVDENAGPNTLVTTVVASDKDGDNVRYTYLFDMNFIKHTYLLLQLV